MGIPARQYGINLRSDIEENVVDMMLSNFRKAHPGLMEMKSTRYEFDPKDTNAVRDWLCSPANEEQAEADLRNIALYGAGVARGRQQHRQQGQMIAPEALEEQQRIVDALKAENVELRNEVARLQRLIAQPGPRLVPQPAPGAVTQLPPRRPDRVEEERAAKHASLSKLALFIVLNPSLVYGAVGKMDAALRIANAANAAGLSTPRGRAWSQANIYTHHQLLEKMIAAIREEIRAGRLTKPRFRKTTEPVNPFGQPYAIAAE